MGPPYLLYFRVKFYVCDPSKLHEEYTRYVFAFTILAQILENLEIICNDHLL